LLRRDSLGVFPFFFDVSSRPESQDNARKLDRAPCSELRRRVEHLPATRNQLRAEHELRKPVRHLDRNFPAVGYPMKKRGGSPVDVGHRHDALCILDTVSEMGRFGTFGGLF